MADEVMLLIYRATRGFPKEEMYGSRRVAVSVPSPIVEGCARESQAESLRFLEIAFGSLRELHYQRGLSKRLGNSDEHEISTCESKIVEAQKILGALLPSMRGQRRVRKLTAFRLQPKQPEQLRLHLV